MNPVRILGALVLAGGAVLVTSVTQPYATASRSWLLAETNAARAEEERPLFYRDPMGAPELSKAPKKDAMGMDYVPVRQADVLNLLEKLSATPSSSPEEPLFYRAAMGLPEISRVPKKDAMGMDFLPVRPADIVSHLPALNTAETESLQTKTPTAAVEKRILYYRNPMGLPDISKVPKKDSMGMDYRPVYEGEDTDSSSIKLAPGKIQRTGVRSEPAQRRTLVSKIRVPGSIQLDERRVSIVATRSDSFVDQVADVTTGDLVKKGQTLLQLYSPEIAAAGAQYLANAGFDGARRRLENLAVPSSLFAEIERTRKVPLLIDWPAPRDGIVLERLAIPGMKAAAGDPLFRIADLSLVWALVDVSEHDYARIKPRQVVTIRARGLPDKIFTGFVGLVYPQINKETRTVRVRVELENPDLILRPDMYVDTEIKTAEGNQVTTVPDSAVIDTGKRQFVILDKGDGRFEPHEVKIGQRGEGLVEIRDGIVENDLVVVAANFLIDAESNLKAALSGLGQSEIKR